MSEKPNRQHTCVICGKNFSLRDLVPGTAIRGALAKEIPQDHPDWSAEKTICRPDLKVNLKAELEIRHLHEKMDHLLSYQWERLAEIQEIQLELLSEIGRKR